MSSEPEHNDSSRLRTLHRYKKAMEALQGTVRKQPGYENTAEYLALLQGLQREAHQYCATIATSIEDILNKNVQDVDDADDTQIKALFEDYEAADLSEDGTLTSYRARWEKQLVERDHFRQYQRVKGEVEARWRSAQVKAREINISTDALLEDYEAALAVVSQAINDSPGNNYLKPLRDKAQAERERIAKERDAMTSGAQNEQFLAVFRYVDEAGDQDYIQLYDLNGKPTERKIKAEALEETKKQAIQVANERVVKYCEDAKAALRRHDPRSAQAELDKVAKFDELKEFIPEAELYKTDVFGLLRDTRAQTEALLNNLEAAEGKVKEAVQRLERERSYPRPAIEAIWQAYSQAIARLQSVDMIERSEDLRRAREYLRETLGALLDKQLDDAEALLKAWQLDDLKTRLGEIDRMYTPIDLLHHEPSWNRWQGLRQEFGQLEDQQKSIRQTLQRLSQQMSSPQQANRSLQALEAQHDPKLLALDPLYETVKARVNLAVNREGELERLRSFLRSNNLAQLEGAWHSAESAAAQDADFMTLAGQLEAHLRYLKACQFLDEGNYEPGISELKALSKRSDLSEQQQKAIEERFEQAQQIVQTSAINDRLIDEAENSATLETAWERLRSVKVFTSQQQRERWKNVLAHTLETLRDDLERPFSLQHFNELMRLAESQDVAFADTWRRSLEQQRTMQSVRDFMEKGDLTNARALLENLLSQVSGPDLTRVRNFMARVEKKLLGKDKDALLRRHQALDAQREDDLAVYQADLERMSTRLQDQVETAKNAENWQDYVELAAWRVEVDLMRAAKTYESARRQNIFHAIADYAGDLGARCRQVAKEVANLPGAFSGYERLGSIASQAKDIQRAIKLCEDHISLESEIDRFQEALKAWETHVKPYADQTALALFKADFDERVSRLITSLRQTTQEQDDLPSYAKLKLLGDTLGDRLIDKLRSASGQINQEFRVIIDTLYNAGSYSHLDRHLRLLAQIEGIKTQIRRLSTLSSTARIFSQIQAGENGEQLAKRCESQVKLLEQSLGLLDEIKRKVDTFFNYLSNYRLTWSRLRDYGDKMNGRARDLRDEVGSACAKLAEKFGGLSIPAPERLDQLVQDHPHMQEAQARLERRKQELGLLARPLIQLDDAFRQEKFREAYQLLESVDEQKLQDHDIYNDFEAVYCDKAVVGWEKARELVDKAWRDWQPLEKWQQEASSYGDWQRDIEEVEQHRRMARFDLAKKLLKWVMDQLQEAEQYRQSAPFVQPCSARGQQLMATMAQERQDYEAQLKKAQAILKAIEDDERQWEALKVRMTGLATRLSQSLRAFCDYRKIGRWAFNNNLYKELQTALTDYAETLEAMKALCPEDFEDYYSAFSQAIIYRRAQNAVRDKNCGG